MNRKRRIFVLAMILLIPTCALGQDMNDWAAKMFDSLSRDFGVVARGTQVIHRFKLTNDSSHDAHIASVVASCGCAKPKCDQMLIKRHDSTFMEVSMDTNRFQRQKEAIITITFDRPQQSVVAIPVKVYIRPDIVVDPSSINFGALRRGTFMERKVSIAYLGRPDWKISGVNTNDRHLLARLVPMERPYGQVHYDLFVRLTPDAPIGIVRQHIILLTNEANCPQIPIPAEASIEDDITVTPSTVEMGSVAPGSETAKAIVIRGQDSFTIKTIEPRFPSRILKPTAISQPLSPLHLASLTFIAPQQVGVFSQEFVVVIPGHTTLTFVARGIVEKVQQTSRSQ